MKKRALRRHHRARVAHNRRKLMLALGQDELAQSPDNQLAVKHPLDCGSRCFMCHGEKFLGGGSRRQRSKIIPNY